MFAKTFLFCLVASAAFLGTSQARDVATYGNADDLKETLAEMKKLYEKYVADETALVKTFVETFVQSYDGFVASSQEYTEKYIAGSKQLFEKLHANGAEMVQKVEACLKSEAPALIEANNQLKAVFTAAIQDFHGELEAIVKDLTATKCYSAVVELTKCQGKIQCGLKAVAAVNACKNEYQTVLPAVINHIVAAVNASSEKIVAGVQEFVGNAQGSVNAVTECSKKAIFE